MNSFVQIAVRALGLFALGLSLAACEHKGTTTSGEKISSEGAGAAKAVELPASACPGHPPSGNLVAHRVVSANSDRTEPGLYEGAVWIKGALYFSDFTFISKGGICLISAS